MVSSRIRAQRKGAISPVELTGACGSEYAFVFLLNMCWFQRKSMLWAGMLIVFLANTMESIYFPEDGIIQSTLILVEIFTVHFSTIDVFISMQ